MRGILIDPVERTVTEIDTKGDLAALYEALQCQVVEAVQVGDGDILWIDEEGLLHDEPGPFFAFRTHPDHPFAGRGLILGAHADGDNRATTLPVERVADLILWPDVEFVGFEPFEIEGPPFVIGNRAIFQPKQHDDEVTK